ncbi:DUF3017 domain-containing protein [Streptomyces sp. Tu 2975]|uniref:DUF3017 domain-containing protein n=1 Tax=Streptomyces sp. Tu 2975 TaxID=2676871 RepID=UPI001359179C|nr:DUF3017 domain-containing protein [Streptomyces sp. Tu 2975]QIP85059.1 DUF3017 domain-containing protein [Streptomyces sp. Tu 2975]
MVVRADSSGTRGPGDGDGTGAPGPDEAVPDRTASDPADAAPGTAAASRTATGTSAEAAGEASRPGAASVDAAPDAAEDDAGAGPDATAADGSGADDADPDRKAGSRRPPAVTLDTARPEGGGRAAPGDAPAPARQWPLLTVLSLTGVGLLIVGTNAFTDAFRVGTMLIGAALVLGAVLRRVTPSVGMLAVRSRFTDMITYGLLGTLIVLLALVAQPKPWLDVPFLEDAVHFTVR